MVASMVHAFEKSCRAMFEHFDATFQRGMTEHTSAAMQQLENANSPLTHALRQVDIPINPREELSRLISERKYEEAFTSALQRRDVSTLNCPLVMFSEMKIMHYSSNHSILLVGEGDFSFAACLARAFGSAPHIVATSLDSRGFTRNSLKGSSRVQVRC
ncbi:varicose-related protein-like [Punica granatum]|uniref:Varicose-related protein-like n=1 Tax=Punica granatum TaxID=22663 RepID=A0A6P8EA98_PUNGR|nr:varicose-related protein-like [Punica granatum]